mmetsp:Transcript_25007/g.83820  ORF Transcript_25007/g.83820 Transcript_25007/m.83820 type:complete len:246 (+) Transcript_25007:107-844(+)
MSATRSGQGKGSGASAVSQARSAPTAATHRRAARRARRPPPRVTTSSGPHAHQRARPTTHDVSGLMRHTAAEAATMGKAARRTRPPQRMRSSTCLASSAAASRGVARAHCTRAARSASVSAASAAEAPTLSSAAAPRPSASSQWPRRRESSVGRGTSSRAKRANHTRSATMVMATSATHRARAAFFSAPSGAIPLLASMRAQTSAQAATGAVRSLRNTEAATPTASRRCAAIAAAADQKRPERWR